MGRIARMKSAAMTGKFGHARITTDHSVRLATASTGIGLLARTRPAKPLKGGRRRSDAEPNDCIRHGLRIDPRDVPAGNRFAYRIALFGTGADRDRDTPLTCWSSTPFRLSRDGRAGPVTIDAPCPPGEYQAVVSLVDLGCDAAEEVGGPMQAVPITVAASSATLVLGR